MCLGRSKGQAGHQRIEAVSAATWRWRGALAVALAVGLSAAGCGGDAAKPVERTAASGDPRGSGIPGDTNGDGIVGWLDVMAIYRHHSTFDSGYDESYDCTLDGLINFGDLGCAYAAMQATLAPGDADGDGSVDCRDAMVLHDSLDNTEQIPGYPDCSGDVSINQADVDCILAPLSLTVADITRPNFSDGKCSAACPCIAGEGQCTEDADCETGNVCVADWGTAFGGPASADVCVPSDGARTVVSEPTQPGPAGYWALDAVEHRDLFGSFDQRVDPLTGRLYVTHTDLLIPGNGGLDLAVTRSFVSGRSDEEVGALGIGWDLHFGKMLHADHRQSTALRRVFVLPSGETIAFYRQADPDIWLSQKRWRYLQSQRRVETADGRVFVLSDTPVYVDGEEQKQVLAHYVTEIADPQGNSISITYSEQPQSPPDTTSSDSQPGPVKKFWAPTQVSTSDGRSVTMTLGPSLQPYGPRLIQSVQTNDGRSWTYAYHAHKKRYLQQVTRPDNKSWRLSRCYKKINASADDPEPWDCSSTLTLDNPAGGRTRYRFYYEAHAYRGRVHKKERLGATWTFIYNLGRTTIYGPTHAERHEYGSDNPRDGDVWRIGLIDSKTILRPDDTVVRRTEYQWAPVVIGPRAVFFEGNGRYDSKTYAPLLTKQSIAQDRNKYLTEYSDYDAYGNAQTIVETGPDGRKRTTNKTYWVRDDPWVRHREKDVTVNGVQAVQRSFTAQGKLDWQRDFGALSRNGYDSQGNLTSVTDPRGKVTTYSGYFRGLATTITHPDGAQVTRGINPSGTIAWQRSPRGHTTRFTYDQLNRVTKIDFPGYSDSLISYPSETVTELRRGGALLRQSKDGFGRVLQADQIVGGQTTRRTFAYDVLDRRTFVSLPHRPGQSAQGDTTSYDELGRVTHVRHSDGTTASTQYDLFADQEKIRSTDESGQVTDTTYLAYGSPGGGQVERIDSPGGMVTELAYNAVGTMTQVSQGLAGGQRVTRFRIPNAQQRPESIFDPELGWRTLRYDAAGNLTRLEWPVVGTTTYSYDARNRRTRTEYPDGQYAAFSYDADGNVVSATNATASRSYGYDSLGQVLSDTLHIGGRQFQTQYPRDAQGNLRRVIYPSGKIVDYGPDAVGQPTRATPFVNTLSRHVSGRAATVDFANSARMTTAETARQWLAQVKVDALSAPPPPSCGDMTFDLSGSSIENAYDFEWKDGSEKTSVCSYVHGYLGYRVDSGTCPDAVLAVAVNADEMRVYGSRGTRGPYARARPTGNTAWSIESRLFKDPDRWRLGNGIWVWRFAPEDYWGSYWDFEWDEDVQNGWTSICNYATGATSGFVANQPHCGQGSNATPRSNSLTVSVQNNRFVLRGGSPETTQVRGRARGGSWTGWQYLKDNPSWQCAGGSQPPPPQPQTIVDLRYENYDGRGNVQRVRDLAFAARDSTLSYDGLSRLATVSNGYGTADTVYDGQSTLTRMGIEGYRKHYFIDPNTIRMTQTVVDGFGAIAVSYDLRGHTVSAEGSTYVFDKADQLREVTRDGKTVYFDYDANGMLVRQRIGQLTRYLVFDGQANLLGQYRPDGSVHREMAWLDGKLVGGWLADGSRSTIHTNALGSPIAFTTEAGTLAAQEAYFVFGERHGHIDPSADPVGGAWFTGRMEDPTSGLIYMGARWYSPSLRRFLSPDPVDFSTDNILMFNRYMYANNNPLRFVDPDGRRPLDSVYFQWGKDEFYAEMRTANRPHSAAIAAVDTAMVSSVAEPIVGSLAGIAVLSTRVGNLFRALRARFARRPAAIVEGQGVVRAERMIEMLEAFDSKTALGFIANEADQIFKAMMKNVPDRQKIQRFNQAVDWYNKREGTTIPQWDTARSPGTNIDDFVKAAAEQKGWAGLD